jgi:hypothetical protein
MVMRFYDILDSEGRIFAFEVGRGLTLSRRRLSAKLKRIPGVNVVREPRFFSWLDDDEFCEFSINGVPFVAHEMFGDNSRFWIGPRDKKIRHVEIDTIRQELSRM